MFLEQVGDSAMHYAVESDYTPFAILKSIYWPQLT
jgi:hypothetical protein